MISFQAILTFGHFFSLIGHAIATKHALLKRKIGTYLPDRVITTEYDVHSEIECSQRCTRLHVCLSVNYKVGGLNKGLCQLNNSTFSEKLGLVSDNEFVHLFIFKRNENTATKIASISTCKTLLDDNSSLPNGVYNLRGGASTEKYPVYCHLTEIPQCGAGGWTLVMKLNGNLNTFKYESPLWRNKDSYAVDDGLEGLTEKETKLASYWNTPFEKICLGMTVNGIRKWMRLDYGASSLYSLIEDGNYRETTAGREAWKSLIAGSSLQLYCNKEGISLSVDRIGVRLGFLANNQNHCGSPDSCIGFGISYAACNNYVVRITCGNIAKCNGGDNGKKGTAAFGYILVQ